MNNRNTYISSKAALTTQKDRPTTNPCSITKTNTEKMGATIDRMISKILNAVGLLPNYTLTSTISRESLKGAGSKVFFDVVTIFLKALDSKIERDSINSETMVDIVKMMGYTGNLNKNIFQPIGAPHTWSYCLSILEWLSQLATFTSNYQIVKQERPFEEDFNSLVFQAYILKEDNKVDQYLKKENDKLQQDIKSTNYTIQTMILSIHNLQQGQRQVHAVEKDIEKEKEMLFRSSQQFIQKNRRLGQLQFQVDKLQEQLSDMRRQLANREKTCEQLEDQIQHQDLSKQQMEQLKQKIQELNLKEFQTQIKIKNYLSAHAKNSDQLMGLLASINRQLREIYERSKIVAQNSGIQFEEITVGINIREFQAYFKNQKAPYDEMIVRTLIGETIIDLICTKMGQLQKALKIKFEEAEKALNLCQSQVATIDNFKKTLKIEIEQAKTRIGQHKKTININTEAIRQRSLSLDERRHHLANKQQLLRQKKEKNASLIEEVKTTTEIMKKLANALAVFQESTDGTIRRRRAAIQEHKQKTWTLVENKVLFVKRLNEQIQLKIKQVKQKEQSSNI